MKRVLISFLFILILLIKSNTSALAIQLMPIQMPPSGNNSLTGENHAYSVILKSNGNAVVMGKINFSNQSTSDQSSYRLEIPGVTPENFIAYQLIPSPICLQYGVSSNIENCTRYDPNPYPDTYNSDFKKAVVETNGNIVKISLPQSVKEASNSGLIVSFNATGYTQNLLGRYNFHFESPKISGSIQTFSLSIDTDNQSLYLHADREQVLASSPKIANIAQGFASSDSIRQIAPMIGSSGRIFKSASSLTPGETVKVTGAYSSSLILLNLDKIAWFVGVVLLLLLLIIIGIKLDLGSKIMAWFESKGKNTSKRNNLVLFDLTIGFVVSLVLVGITAVFKFLGNNFLNTYNNDFIWQMILLVFVFLLYGGLLVLPGVLMGMKFGWKHLLWVILFEMVWLGVFLAGYALIFAPVNSGPGQIVPMVQTKSP